MADDSSVQGSIWPLPRFCFSVDFGDGKPQGFAEISGIESDLRTIEYRHSDSPTFSAIKMPGLRSVGNVILKKGLLSRDSVFWDWMKETQLNIVKRRSIVISLLDEKATPKMRWTLSNAWPVKITGTDLKSDGSDVAIESVEIAYETLSAEAA